MAAFSGSWILLFVAPTDGDYRLQSTSPLINKGDNAIIETIGVNKDCLLYTSKMTNLSNMIMAQVLKPGFTRCIECFLLCLFFCQMEILPVCI